MPDIKICTYFGDDADAFERQVQDLVDRGGRVVSLSIVYGPSPAKVAGLSYGRDTWYAMVVVDASEIDPDA